MHILETIILQPIFNLLILLYGLLGDMGLAIIAITVLVRLLLLPLANKALRSQRRLQALQPELKKLQEKHKDNREVMARELMEFYRREGVSPASSCLPLLVQIPILITLFIIFRNYALSDAHLNLLYSFVPRPGHINPLFFGLVDLAKKDPTYVLAALAAVLQFFQSRMLLPKDPAATPAINRQMIYFFPLLTFVFAGTLPAALPLYWVTTTLFTLIQQSVIMREMPMAKAKTEGAKDWNAANPADPVPVAVAKPKRGRGKPKGGKTKGATVTVRKRGDA